MSLRADVPVALDLLVCFWKSLKGEPLSLVDLKEADSVTYSLTQEIIEVNHQQLIPVHVLSLFMYRLKMKLVLMKLLALYVKILIPIQQELMPIPQELIPILLV